MFLSSDLVLRCGNVRAVPLSSQPCTSASPSASRQPGSRATTQNAPTATNGCGRSSAHIHGHIQLHGQIQQLMSDILNDGIEEDISDSDPEDDEPQPQPQPQPEPEPEPAA
jgi:hypothetical protein